MKRVAIGIIAGAVVASTLAFAQQGKTPDGRPIDPEGMKGKPKGLTISRLPPLHARVSGSIIPAMRAAAEASVFFCDRG